MVSHFFFLSLFTVLSFAKADSSSQFLVIGDWGFLPDPKNFKTVTQAMADYVQTHRIDYIMTVGDNIYQSGISEVGDETFDQAMDLIQDHDNLKHIPIYSVLGNHDCYGNPQAQVEMNGKRNYMMPSDYYSRDLDFDEDGETDMSILFLNSCLLVCKNNMEQHCPRMPISKDTDAIQRHYKWLDQKLKAWDNSPNIWKVIVNHWPAVQIGRAGDFPVVKKYMLPLFQNHTVDVFYGGHTHTSQYLSIDYQPEGEWRHCEKESQFKELRELYYGKQEEVCPENKRLKSKKCKHEIEIIPGDEREINWTKGDKMHQVIVGASGVDKLAKLCEDADTFGELHFANNKKHSFLHGSVNKDSFTMKYVTNHGEEVYNIKIRK